MRMILFVAVITGAVASTTMVLNLFFGGEERIYFGYLHSTPMKILVADSEDERAQGLSGRTTIGEQEGLLFVFEKPGLYGVWMKNMTFSIDVFWLDEDLRVVHIESALTPDTYPRVFKTPIPALYVLETREGFAEEFKISLKDKLSVFPDTPKLFKNKPFLAF